MTIQELINRKLQLGYTAAYISEISGVPLSTVRRIFSGKTRLPRASTLQALERALGFSGEEQAKTVRESQSALLSSYAKERGPSDGNSCRLSDLNSIPKNCYPLLPYKHQGEYTAEDRDRLPDDIRTELIDGVLYDMASPSRPHQAVLGELYAALRNCIRSHERDCYIFLGPSDVWLSNDGRNILQPDLYVVCENVNLGADSQNSGAPSFVVEILSPTTRSRDLLLKTFKYSQAGVKEYWVVDLQNRQIYTFRLDLYPDGSNRRDFDFTSVIPIGITNGTCQINFQQISETLSSMGL